MKSYLKFIETLNEAALVRQDKADTMLLSLQGDEFAKSRTKSIIDVMRGKITEERKKEVVDYINKMTGKKILFYNVKGGKNIKKERILDPAGYAYWKGVRLFFKGQVKDYEVNITKDFGYYGKPVKKPVIICALDPYDEEDWDA